MMNVSKNTHVHRVWFAGNNAGDLLAWITQESGDAQLQFGMRLRMHVDNKAFDSKDEKKFIEFSADANMLEHVIVSIEDRVLDFKRRFGADVLDRFMGGSPTEMMEWMKTKSWCHIRTQTLH